jgi:DNA-binding GntR family transcriptional regulator
VAPRRRDIGDEHQQILDAVLARDANKAVELLARHLRVTTDILLSATTEEAPQRRRSVRSK